MPLFVEHITFQQLDYLPEFLYVKRSTTSRRALEVLSEKLPGIFTLWASLYTAEVLILSLAGKARHSLGN